MSFFSDKSIIIAIYEVFVLRKLWGKQRNGTVKRKPPLSGWFFDWDLDERIHYKRYREAFLRRSREISSKNKFWFVQSVGTHMQGRMSKRFFVRFLQFNSFRLRSRWENSSLFQNRGFSLNMETNQTEKHSRKLPSRRHWFTDQSEICFCRTPLLSPQGYKFWSRT